MKTTEKTTAIPFAAITARELLETMTYALLAIATPAVLAHTPNNQWITGTVVNAVLFIACYRVGIVNAIFVGLLPSVIALMRGLLPLPMAAILPYIMLGNAAMVSTFALIKVDSLMIRVLASSLLKFGILFFAATYFVSIPAPISQMMTWPQLITAIAGGLLAIGTIKVIRISTRG